MFTLKVISNKYNAAHNHRELHDLNHIATYIVHNT